MEFHGLSSEFYSVFWSFDWIPPFPLLKLLCSYYISRVIASFKWCTQNSPKSNINCISSYLFCWEMHGNQRLESPAWAAELTKSIRKQHRISSSWSSGGLTCKIENWKIRTQKKNRWQNNHLFKPLPNETVDAIKYRYEGGPTRAAPQVLSTDSLSSILSLSSTAFCTPRSFRS